MPPAAVIDRGVDEAGEESPLPGEESPLPGEASEPGPPRSSRRRASSNEDDVETGERSARERWAEGGGPKVGRREGNDMTGRGLAGAEDEMRSPPCSGKGAQGVEDE